MRLRDISINNLRRRKAKVFFLVLGLTIGITTVVALISITRMMNDDISRKLGAFGANILTSLVFNYVLRKFLIFKG